MSKLRQQILILHLKSSDLASKTIAWACYDGALSASERQMQSGDSVTPPYSSVLEAMQDGWFVIQLPALPTYLPGHEHETNNLPYEYVLERKVEINE
ncbi:hypothetical protein [Tengunoibacter tsumagoiensis]|uniref:Uncharacterized protein n=1 Tax=Tengunoibacter tsumagoiensis TaxID=2014871 RepID=A0A402AA24_9CHLR|nr:hypothetical protein [Tengunoibacter tsumagoiensis]GCE16022.1 hypothetical protein KTT_58810 [Tengunoibacter tsumagoiensis]